MVDYSKNKFSLSYQYKTIRKDNEIVFQEIDNQRNKICTEWMLKISKLRNKEILKSLTLTELTNFKILIEEIIQEKKVNNDRRNNN